MPTAEPASPGAGPWWTLVTPSGARGALACIVLGPDHSRSLLRLGLPAVEAGRARVLDVPGVDQMVVFRWEDSLHLMPHGGPAVMGSVIDWLETRGFFRRTDPSPRALFPEAGSDLEAWMLWTIARAASPGALPALLAQPAAWGRSGEALPGPDDSLSTEFRRLVDPPLLVAVGPSNIGKSSLLNALAGRRVSIVADEPGTTRDHVGALVELDGLVVRWVDTPGLRATPNGAEAAAFDIAMTLVPHADLLLLCSDPGAEVSAEIASRLARSAGVLTVGLRSDLGPPLGKPDACVSLRDPEALADFARIIRTRLVGDRAMQGLEPLWFWPPALWRGP